MKLAALTLVASLLTSTAFAALPPLYETLKEFKTLIEDPRLEHSLTSADAIEKIERNEQGFVITTNKRTLIVKIAYEPAMRPGPAKYKLIFETDTEESSN
jgi:hypothetical protein